MNHLGFDRTLNRREDVGRLLVNLRYFKFFYIRQHSCGAIQLRLLGVASSDGVPRRCQHPSASEREKRGTETGARFPVIRVLAYIYNIHGNRRIIGRGHGQPAVLGIIRIGINIRY